MFNKGCFSIGEGSTFTFNSHCSSVCLSLLGMEKHNNFLLNRSSVNVKMFFSAVPTDWMQFCT